MLHRFSKLSGYVAVACILLCMTAAPGLDAKAQSTAGTEQSSGTDTNSSQSGISGKNYLLYGYDSIQGGFINTTNTGYKPILDKCNATVADADPASYSKTSYSYNSSIRKFYEQFSGAFSGSYSGVAFSGEVDSEFTTTRDISENREYMRYTSYFYNKDISNDTAVSNLSEYLSPSFISDVEAYYKNNPHEIFKIYGTHLIMQYYTGGRLDVNFSYTNTDTKSESDIKASVAATYAKISSTASAEDEKKAQLVDQHSSLTSESAGGPTQYQVSGTSIASIADQFSQWKSHIDDKPDICGIKDGALLGVWELFPKNSDIYKALYNEYQKELVEKETALDNLDGGLVTDITVLVGNSKEEAIDKLPKGYYIALALDPGSDCKYLDANHRGGGQYIYIAYTYQPVTDVNHKNLNPIIDFCVLEGKNCTKDGYTKIPIDLNKSQGKKTPFLYLFYRRANQEQYNDPQQLFVSRVGGYYYTDYVLPANWYTPENSIQLNDGVKAKEGHDDYVNLVFQNTYRDMAAPLSIGHGDKSVVAASQLLTAETDDDKDEAEQSTDVSSNTAQIDNPKTGTNTKPLECAGVICLLSASALLFSRKMMCHRHIKD